MTVKAPIVITGDNIDLTPALSDYVNQKIEKTLGKIPTAVSHCDVYLTVNKNPKVSLLLCCQLRLALPRLRLVQR
jgi:putative sigma-54 modulation protein